LLVGHDATMTERAVHIRKGRRDFLTSKRDSDKSSTVRCYESITRDFVEYLEENGIERTDSIDGFLISQWKIKRTEEDNVSPATIHNNTKHIRVFIRWLEASEMVDSGLADKIQIPNVNEEQLRSDDTVNPDTYESIISHLELYEYATRLHVITKFLWHTGCRISGLIALDLKDYDAQQNIVKFRNRRQLGTALKNGEKSERNVSISDEMKGLLNDYIEGRRCDVRDEYDRQPLFTTEHGRMARQRVYKNFTAISRPCVYANNCPHGREINECEAARKKKQAFSCPSSESLHPIRRGALTYHLNQGWPIEKVSEKCDVTENVLREHYDTRTHEDKRQGRRQYVDKL